MSAERQYTEIEHIRAELLGSFTLFIQVFYKLLTGREFIIRGAIDKIIKELVQVFYGSIQREIINCPPGSGKSELCKFFIAWCLAHYPDSQNLYISYSHELSSEHTYGIKQIMSLPYYKLIFGVHIARDSSAKDNFKTTAGGAVYASGSAGSITGRNAGLPGESRFTGLIIIDDIHKPDEVYSDTIREKVNNNYFTTIINRLRSPTVPIIFIGQRLHEDDLAGNLLDGKDGYEWKKVIIKGLDDNGNATDPAVHTKEKLEILKRTAPYVFYSQYQQNPQPAGGSLFKRDWFVLTDKEPEILASFIIGDTAETEKRWNDPTVFSFFGIYRIEQVGVVSDIYGLHWIDCIEDWVEPKDLEDMFNQFYASCMRYKVKPSFVAIEKKSTGTTLLSRLNQIQGMRVLDIERSSVSGSKTKRFIDTQPYAAAKLTSIPRNGSHTQKVLDHMEKITANNTHAHDDIADTYCDGVRLGLVENVALNYANKMSGSTKNALIQKKLNEQMNMRAQRWR